MCLRLIVGLRVLPSGELCLTLFKVRQYKMVVVKECKLMNKDWVLFKFD